MPIAIQWSALVSLAMAMLGCMAQPDRSAAIGYTQPPRPPLKAVDDDDSGTSDDDSGVDTADAAALPLATHSILVGELVNARDLGGVPIAGLPSTKHTRVAYGALFRGPPLLLSPTGCDAFAKLGVRTILDLRIASESELKPDAPCSTDTARLVTAPLPVPYDVSPQDYIADLDAGDSMAKAFAVLGDDAAYPVYFHCTWGRDRTGIVAAVILLALGAAREDVMREYLLSLPSVGAYPMSLAAVFDEIERRGGVEAYLAALGIGARQLATLRAHALARP